MATAATMQPAFPAPPAAPASALARLGILALFGVLAVVGLATLIYRMGHGLSVTRLGSVVPWGLWVAFYIYFIGLSAGSFLLSTLVFVFKNKTLEPVGRLAVLQAFVCLLTGLVFILIDLGHWERFWHVIIYPQWNSVLAWEIWFYNFYIVLLLVELRLLMRHDLARWAEAACGWRRFFYRTLSLGFRCPTTSAEEEACANRMGHWLRYSRVRPGYRFAPARFPLCPELDRMGLKPGRGGDGAAVRLWGHAAAPDHRASAIPSQDVGDSPCTSLMPNSVGGGF